jgi:ribosomal-protein-serine acetyltransferase
MSQNSPTFDVDGFTTLRPLAEEDAADLFALVDRNRQHLRTWLPWLDSSRRVEDTQAFLALAVERGRAGRGMVWTIAHSNIMCGVAGFNWIEPFNRVCEIGYWLDADYQGRGIVTRSVYRLIRHAYEDLQLNRITIPVAVENKRSRAVPERLGFRAEGVLREAEWLYDHWVDHVLYALIHSDWRGAPAAT